MGHVGHDPRVSGHVGHNPRTAAAGPWGMGVTTPVDRGMCATSPKVATPEVATPRGGQVPKGGQPKGGHASRRVPAATGHTVAEITGPAH
jgi:hypothetical protein